MKKLSRTLVTLGVLGACAAPISSFAADGTITFVGSVISSTCNVNSAGAGNQGDKTVTLPPVAEDTLKSPGAVAGTTPLIITLQGCGNATYHNAYAVWELNNAPVDLNGNLQNIATTLPATGVAIQLLNNGLVPINLRNSNNGVPGPSTGETAATLDASGNGTLNYYAQYYANAAAVAGAVSSRIQFSIAYQ
ncbi:fimbrial protein [Burkholderia sp. L27(2015)]|uniref:fimbrial protein n=1 Tax=Burkholderia sp. L27(2015) TaxID=1641858 RepID=UPI00131BF1FE|nr:fimbrial protein [Burkholderia sp. L27(2015)]